MPSGRLNSYREGMVSYRMGYSGLTVEQLTQLQAIFSRFPTVWAVYLFGSVAEGRTHAESDLDLAVVPRPDCQPPDVLDLLTELARQGFDNIDLVLLSGDDLLLAYEAVRHNQVLYATDDFDRGSFFSKVIREFLDFLPYLEVQNRYYKERMLSGSDGNPT